MDGERLDSAPFFGEKLTSTTLTRSHLKFSLTDIFSVGEGSSH
jgi:hypothetical protein